MKKTKKERPLAPKKSPNSLSVVSIPRKSAPKTLVAYQLPSAISVAHKAVTPQSRSLLLIKAHKPAAIENAKTASAASMSVLESNVLPSNRTPILAGLNQTVFGTPPSTAQSELENIFHDSPPILPGFMLRAEKSQQQLTAASSRLVTPPSDKLMWGAMVAIDYKSAAEAKELSEISVLKKIDTYFLQMSCKGGCIDYNVEMNAYKAYSLCSAYLIFHPQSKAVNRCLDQILKVIDVNAPDNRSLEQRAEFKAQDTTPKLPENKYQVVITPSTNATASQSFPSPSSPLSSPSPLSLPTPALSSSSKCCTIL
jgi:hypothetical protein